MGAHVLKLYKGFICTQKVANINVLSFDAPKLALGPASRYNWGVN